MGTKQPISTRRPGDDGTTTLSAGLRVYKNSPYIQAIGMADEVSCLLGMVIAAGGGSDVAAMLAEAQADMLHLSAELSQPGDVFLTLDRVLKIETQFSRLSVELPSVDGNILPAGTMAAAMCFKARATCRTLEREMVSLEESDPEASLGSVRIPYLNRLADLLFVLARTINRRANAEVIAEVPVPASNSRQ